MQITYKSPKKDRIAAQIETLNALLELQDLSDSIELTYAELFAHIAAGTLIPSTAYLITDYQTVHTIPNTTDTNTGPLEPLLVTATAVNKLAPIAFSPAFPDDIIFYNPSNNQTMVPGCTKGYIYRRIDTKQNNDLPLDFRSVKIVRSTIQRSIFSDYASCTNNKFAPNINDLIVNFNNAFEAETRNNIFGSNCYNNSFGEECKNNVIKDDFYNNTISWGFSFNRIDSSFQNNTIGDEFKDNTVGTEFFGNTVGNSFKFNTIGAMCNSCTFADGFKYNVVGVESSGNTFGLNNKNNVLPSFLNCTTGTNFQNNHGPCAEINLSAVSQANASYYCFLATNASGGSILAYYNASNILTIVTL